MCDSLLLTQIQFVENDESVFGGVMIHFADGGIERRFMMKQMDKGSL